MSTLTQFLGGSAASMPLTQEFTTSGTFTPSAKLLAAGGRVEVLLVAGGGGATYSATKVSGGGGGGVVRKVVTVSSNVSITIGAGGTTGAPATNGGSSSFGALISVDGGDRAIADSDPGNAKSGGGSGGLYNSSSSPNIIIPGGYGTDGYSSGGTPYYTGQVMLGGSVSLYGGGGRSNINGSNKVDGQNGYCLVTWHE